MNHAIVEWIARRSFRRVSEKNVGPLSDACPPEVHPRFRGDPALGVERHDREGLGRWFGRLGRALTPTVGDVCVKGLPHDTTAIVRWSATDRLPHGSPDRNRAPTS